MIGGSLLLINFKIILNYMIGKFINVKKNILITKKKSNFYYFKIINYIEKIK